MQTMEQPRIRGRGRVVPMIPPNELERQQLAQKIFNEQHAATLAKRTLPEKLHAMAIPTLATAKTEEGMRTHREKYCKEEAMKKAGPVWQPNSTAIVLGWFLLSVFFAGILVLAAWSYSLLHIAVYGIAAVLPVVGLFFGRHQLERAKIALPLAWQLRFENLLLIIKANVSWEIMSLEKWREHSRYVPPEVEKYAARITKEISGAVHEIVYLRDDPLYRVRLNGEYCYVHQWEMSN